MENSNGKQLRKEVCSLWVRESKAGMKYLSGYIVAASGKVPVVGFRNTRKDKDNPETEKQPDWVLYKDEPREEKPKAEYPGDLEDSL